MVFSEVCADNQGQPCALIKKCEFLLSYALAAGLFGKAAALISVPSGFQP